MLEFVDVAAVVHFWFGLGIQLYRFIHIVLGKARIFLFSGSRDILGQTLGRRRE